MVSKNDLHTSTMFFLLLRFAVRTIRLVLHNERWSDDRPQITILTPSLLLGQRRTFSPSSSCPECLFRRILAELFSLYPGRTFRLAVQGDVPGARGPRYVIRRLPQIPAVALSRVGERSPKTQAIRALDWNNECGSSAAFKTGACRHPTS